MMFKLKHCGLGILLGAAAIGAVGCSGGEKEPTEITLSYAFFAPAQTFPAVQMQRWADEVHERTNGQVTVKLFPGSSLLTASNMYDGVASGVADIGLSATSYEPGRFPLINLAGSLTGQDVDSETASTAVFQLIEEFGDEMPGLKDFKVITAFTSEPAYIQTIDPVRKMEDLNNKQVRISGSNSPSLEALGASAVGMSQAEAAEALQTGVIDGYAASREVLMDMQFARTVKYVTDYPLTNTIFAAVMTQEAWDKLPENVQTIIDELAPEMAEFTGSYLDEHIQRSLTWAQNDQGVEIISLAEDEEARWNTVLAPFNEQVLTKVEDQGLPARAFANRFYELIGADPQP